jgi:hypothetical protein
MQKQWPSQKSFVQTSHQFSFPLVPSPYVRRQWQRSSYISVITIAAAAAAAAVVVVHSLLLHYCCYSLAAALSHVAATFSLPQLLQQLLLQDLQKQNWKPNKLERLLQK